MNNRTRSAFSLVELVIVIVIIGIIAAIAVPRFSSATDSANDKQAVASVRIIQNALDLALAEHAASMVDTSGTKAANETAMLAFLDEGATTNLLTDATDVNGVAVGATDYGPYLRQMPSNLIVADTADDWKTDTDGPGTGNTTIGWGVKWENNGFLVGYADANDTFQYP